MASIFVGIAAAEHTFAAWAEKEWAVVFKKAPQVEQVLAATLKYAGPALETVISAEQGAASGDMVSKAIADAQAGLVAASGLVYDFGATPTVGGVLNSVSSNLNSLLAAGHVTNSTSVATVGKVVNELSALAAALTPTVVAAAA